MSRNFISKLPSCTDLVRILMPRVIQFRKIEYFSYEDQVYMNDHFVFLVRKEKSRKFYWIKCLWDPFLWGTADSFSLYFIMMHIIFLFYASEVVFIE